MASDRARAGREPPPLSSPAERQKRAAARAAAEFVTDGMRLGLGTGSTVAHLLPAIAERTPANLCCVATSPATERAARALGLTVLTLDEVGALDLAIDGADQIDRAGWLVKGGGGAHTREKIVAAAAARFIVIASAEKAVEALTAPIPVEILAFGADVILRSIGDASLRPADGSDRVAEAPGGDGLGSGTGSASAGALVSPDGGLIADYHGPIGDPLALARRLSETPGVIEHGLFPPEMVSLMLIAGEAGVEERAGAGRPI
jgi:ribose 5-phosphate isomerase A